MTDYEPDFLDEVIAESTAQNPEFPKLMAQAKRNREILATLRERRKSAKVSQKSVAIAMSTTQSAISDLEKNAADAKVSTIEKYAGALGYTVQFHLLPVAQASVEPAVVVHEAA